MIDEWRIGKDLEGSGRDLIKALPRGTEENHEHPYSA
jgi:hypothetical protein